MRVTAGEMRGRRLIAPPYDLLPVIAHEMCEGIAAVLAPGAIVAIEHARGAIIPPGGSAGIAAERHTTRRYGDTEITVMWMPGEGT